MTYYINPLWFYFISIAENLSFLMGVLALISFGFIFIYCFFGLIDKDLSPMESLEGKRSLIIIFIISTILAIFIPSKETCEEMLIASCVTHENVDYAENEVKELVDYIFEKVEAARDDKEE